MGDDQTAIEQRQLEQQTEVKALKGEFYGTDFNFLYSEEMQSALAHNCLNSNWDQVMNFSQHNTGQIHDELGQYVNNNGMQLDLDQQINEIVRESFKTTKKYIWKGVFTFLFYFAALYTLKDGVLPIMAQTFPGSENAQEKINSNTSTYMPQIPSPNDPTDPTNPIQPDTDIQGGTTVTGDDLND